MAKDKAVTKRGRVKACAKHTRCCIISMGPRGPVMNSSVWDVEVYV
jgi:hypothetical protein